MSDTLKIYGNTYTGIESIKAEDPNGNELTYIRPQGTKSITDNGTGIDVAAYATVNVSVSGGGGNEFIITVSKNNQTGYWEPDCTWADLSAAYSGGKTIAMKTNVGIDVTADCTLDYMPTELVYSIAELFSDNQGEDYWIVQQEYNFSNNGVSKVIEYAYYDSSLADATASDLLSGKIAYGQNGRITGSATARTSSDLSVSGNTVTAPAGFYSSSASASVASGTEGTPTATKGTVSNHSVSVTPSVTNSAGYISGGTKTGTAVSVSASELVSGSETKTANGTYDVTNLASLVVNVPTGTARTSSDVTVSGDTVSVPAGLYSSAVSKSVASGTAGTPTATKGTVSNHSVSVTPSVTNTTGYITGSTKTGTAVTVSASELVSGSETKNANGTYDVTNLASLVVAVPIVTYYTGSSAPSSSLGSNGDIYLQTS